MVATTWIIALCMLTSLNCNADNHISMKTTVIPANDDRLQPIGRMQFNKDGSASFGYPGVGFRLTTNAKHLGVNIKSTGSDSYIAVRIDGGEIKKLKLLKNASTLSLFAQDTNESRVVELLHHSETWHGTITLNQFILSEGDILPAPALPERKILVIGDSVTCGEGANRDGAQACEKDTSWWNAHRSYGWLTGEALNAQVQLVCYGGRGLIRSWNGNTNEINGPDFYELTIAQDNGTQWKHAAYPADLIVVSLGTNDFSLGIGPLPTADAFVPAYVTFVKKLLADHPKAEIVLTDGAIVSDGEEARPQRTVLRRYLHQTKQLADNERVHVFDASHFPGDECDAHPTGPQHAKMSQELVAYIQKTLKW